MPKNDVWCDQPLPIITLSQLKSDGLLYECFWISRQIIVFEDS